MSRSARPAWRLAELKRAEFRRQSGPPRAAPARWPFGEHRTMAEVMLDEALPAEPEWTPGDE